MAETRKKGMHRPAARSGEVLPRGATHTAENLGEGALAVQGNYNNVEYKHITYVYGNTPPSVEEETELQRLKTLVPQKVTELISAIKARRPSGENPYHLLEALDVHERDLLAGRESLLDDLTVRLEAKRFAILAGPNGIGKTSLLRAGFIPAVADAGGWPIRIEIGGEAVGMAIKKAVLGSLEGSPSLAAHPLRDVLQLASAFIPSKKEIVLFLDNLEELFKQPAQAQMEFVQTWKECVNDPALDTRWLFSISGVTHQLNRFQSGEINPFANLFILGPLDRDAARKAILKPAQAVNLRMEDALVDILLSDLGNNEIEPTRLQIVCHSLALGRREIMLVDYVNARHVDGIMQDYLDRAIGELAKEQREAAWQVLSILDEFDNRPSTNRQIANQLTSYGYRDSQTESLIQDMERKHLLSFNEDGYRLASENMSPRIREWRSEQAAFKLARQEAARQVQRVRNSAIRGLFGGALGMVLFNSVVYTGPVYSIDLAIILTTMLLSTGGIAGVVLTLIADLVRATYPSRPWLRYLLGGASGALAYVIAVSLYATTIHAFDFLLQKLPAAILEGALWGTVIGLGLTWGLETRRPIWLTIGITSILGGVILMGLDFFGQALSVVAWEQKPSALLVFLGGAIAPLVYLSAALAGQSDFPRKERIP